MNRDIERTTTSREPEMELDLLHKPFGEEGTVESELMRLHNLAGPPRFLFPIKEETKEDLESEDRSRKGSRTRSLSDLMLTIDTPFLTPVASSPLKCCLQHAWHKGSSSTPNKTHPLHPSQYPSVSFSSSTIRNSKAEHTEPAEDTQRQDSKQYLTHRKT